MSSGFQEIVISVFDIAHFAEAFVEVGGYGFRSLPDAPPEQFTAWHVPRECRRIEQALLTPENDDKGFVRLVKFHGAEQRVMRSSQRSWDFGGIFDLDLYATDARASFAALERLGWTALGPPLDYQFGDFRVCEVLALGPAGIAVALIQPYSPPMVALPHYSAWSRAFNSSHIVGDFRRSMDFYLKTLGWKALIDVALDDEEEPKVSVLGIPKAFARQTPQSVSIVHPEGTNDGSIELISMPTLMGHDFAADCVAPHVGYLSYRFPCSNLDLYAVELQASGVALYAPPLDLVIEPYGAVRSLSIRSPDGVILEFFERHSASPS